MVPHVSSYDGRRVIGADGRFLGRVSAVLFHADQPLVVGVEIDPGAVLGVVDRPRRFALLADLTGTGEDSLQLSTNKLPRQEAGERTLGFGWDSSVIWRNMPVRSAEGDPVGVVHDVEFAEDTGAVIRVWVSTGMVGDAALGRLEVPGALVRGFSGDHVVVLPGYRDIVATGGVAKAAATGAAAVKVRGEQVADGVLQVGVAAAGALGRSMKSGFGRKAIDKVKSLMDEE
ncbi:MAG: PRC-barrel domain-containing protein [Coriobacteriia bacterium]|nr:PRC-barrel domain-containing protein [Coriobacteriia bacterium]